MTLFVSENLEIIETWFAYYLNWKKLKIPSCQKNDFCGLTWAFLVYISIRKWQSGAIAVDGLKEVAVEEVLRVVRQRVEHLSCDRMPIYRRSFHRRKFEVWSVQSCNRRQTFDLFIRLVLFHSNSSSRTKRLQDRLNAQLAFAAQHDSEQSDATPPTK